MDQQLLTLSKIFTERLFRIPDYQRGYAWTEPQWRDFWNDIQQIEEGGNHYTGVLTLETVPAVDKAKWADDSWIIDNKGYEAFYVVDGQQRLTTAIILIQAIIETVDVGETLNYTPVADIRKKFIYDSKDKGISRSYIFGYDKDNPSYEFLKTHIFREFSSSDAAEETVYTNNLEMAKIFFLQRISEFNLEQLEVIYKKITQSILFNIFTISEEVDVCVAFETMNNRGKPLSYLELLKNRLIYLSLKLGEEDSEKSKLRASVNDCWKAIYHSLGRNKKEPLDDDTFLGTHYILYFLKPEKESGDVEKSPDVDVERIYRRGILRGFEHYTRLLQEIFVSKRIGSTESPIGLHYIYSYVQSLQTAVNSWYYIFNPSEIEEDPQTSVWLDKLKRIGSDGFLPIILSTILKVDKDVERVQILKAVERHIFVTGLVGYYNVPYSSHGNFIKEAVYLYNGLLSAKQVSARISEATQDILSLAGVARELRSNFRSRGYYDWKNIKYFLYEYNLDIQSRSKTERSKINWKEYNDRYFDHTTVEHIYPQNARASYWTSNFAGFTPKQRDFLKNSLGNLVPLSKPKNSSLSNKPFPEKVDGKKDVFVGFRYGCYAENEVAKETDWTPRRIKERGLRLLSFMEKRWSINLGTEEEKIELLNLDFVD
jgi:hypothetical protein